MGGGESTTPDRLVRSKVDIYVAKLSKVMILTVKSFPKFSGVPIQNRRSHIRKYATKYGKICDRRASRPPSTFPEIMGRRFSDPPRTNN